MSDTFSFSAPQETYREQYLGWRVYRVMLGINPSTPKSDRRLISPYHITAESNMKVRRIKELITN